VEGTDLSVGYGSLGGDLAAFQLTGEEIGKRIRRTLDTGQAPAGVTVDSAPRRRVLDWRQMKRFGISESRVPRGFQVLYKPPSLLEQHRDAFLTLIGGLLLQAILISVLLTERRRRAETREKMRRQLNLETIVSKASADLSAVTRDLLPARLQVISEGLSRCIGIEKVSVWMHVPEAHDYLPVHWWPESRTPINREGIALRFPYLLGELLAARTVSVSCLDELPSAAAPDAAELRALGFLSVLIIPLNQGEVPIGALVLGTYDHVAKWDSETTSTLQLLADILAQAISRSMSEERVRRSEEQNRAMLASLPGFVLMIDGGGQILRQNNRMELVEAELPTALAGARVGQNLLELWWEDGEADYVAQALEEAASGHRKSLVMEHRYETGDGARWVEVHAESLSEEQCGAVVSVTDITERKKNESENAQNRQTAWHLNRVAALGELTASLAHEVNQPLAAILSSGEAAFALLNRPSPDVAETLEAVRDIIEDAKRAGAVIHRIRTMLRRGRERTQAVDLDATVNETLRLVYNEARLRHVILRHLATPDLPPIVADATQLQQVILNLITNGMEAAETMPGHREVEIRAFRGGADGMQFLEVRDNGPGIPAGMKTAIFEPFYTSKREGLGLGLSICRSIVESFGGRITVENPPGGGALFLVMLRTSASAYEELELVSKAGV
jgi:PAS domain S-box-containing protein